MILQTEEKDYGRDLNSKALINKNIGAFEEHKARKAQTERLSALEEKTEQIAKDFVLIKDMLQQLLDR